MIVPWSPVVFVDIVGSIAMVFIAGYCAILSRRLTESKPDDIFRNYIFLFTLAIVFFAVSRSFGHLIKQLLLLNDMQDAWDLISPFSGAVNSITFVVIFAFGIYFHRFQKVHSEVEYYKNNLEEMIAARTNELNASKNTLENILNNSNPINITDINYDVIQANEAYYALWPRTNHTAAYEKCYESRPGSHCHTEECPLRQILDGHDEVSHEITKNVNGEPRDFIASARAFRDVDGNLIGMVESFQDITLRKQAEQAMRESEERFRKIFESNPDPVILIRLDDGMIVNVNREFEAATGISRNRAINHPFGEIGLWNDPDLLSSLRWSLQAHGTISNYEAAFGIPDGSIKTGLISATLLHVRDEPCILLVIRDITTEKAAEQALIEMDRMKSEFISTAAHELNTPLSAMMGYTEFLRFPEKFGQFTEEQKQDFLSEVYERGESLIRIVEDLLDISRIESGHPLPLNLEATDITETLARKVRLFLALNPQRTIRLDLPDPVQQSVVLIDRQRINQVLDNLMSNAVKYSPKKKEIVIHGRTLPDGWEIRVEDKGNGMTPDQLDRIFDKFYRADASNTAISGLGLGMSISRQIIEAHGGEIRVASSVGEGTTVSFTLPFRTPGAGGRKLPEQP